MADKTDPEPEPAIAAPVEPEPEPKPEPADPDDDTELDEAEPMTLTKDDIEWIKAQRKIKADAKPIEEQPPQVIKVASLKMEKIETPIEPEPKSQPKPKSRRELRRRTLKIR